MRSIRHGKPSFPLGAASGVQHERSGEETTVPTQRTRILEIFCTSATVVLSV
ncbi:hypothetical protein [Acinetobacter baumannii]|uniref:hypothetical protein n=1 Tax=Acinetobacter baumannii TaxID=470 RepID=UPI00366FDE10